MAVDLVGIQTVDHLNRIFQLNNHDFSVSSNIQQAVNALKRSGHARFRRSPATSSSDTQTTSVSSRSEDKEFLRHPRSCNSTDKTLSFQSMSVDLEVDGSVSNGKQFSSSLGIVAPSLSFSSRKPPLPSSHRKRQTADRLTGSGHVSGKDHHSVSQSGCHCCKKRKTGLKREVRKIPVTGSKVESIPADDYSWKKYGEKKINGSLLTRVYYKCNSVKGCPARKSVELSSKDSKMLIVTYDKEHRHTPVPLPVCLNGLQLHSK